jgi:hypothetical protein
MINKLNPDNALWSVEVKTIKDLKIAISDLADDLPVKQGFSDSCDVVIFNRLRDDIHVSFDEGGQWSNEH